MESSPDKSNAVRDFEATYQYGSSLLYTAISDLLKVYFVFQKKLQSNQLTLDEMDRCSVDIQKSLATLEQTTILGGWEETVINGQTERLNGKQCSILNSGIKSFLVEAG